MAKGPVVTDKVDYLIAKIHQDHPKWKAPVVQCEASHLLHKKDPNLPANWPGLSAVQKVLATVRRKEKELPDDPQEKPWRMDTLDKHPIPPEAVPSVLKLWKSRIENGNTFTIREAKWASRLSRRLEDIEKLSYKASQYARTELMYQLIGRPFDSTGLDRLLEGLPVGVRYFEDILPFLAEQRENQDKGIKDGVEVMREQVRGIKQKGGTK